LEISNKLCPVILCGGSGSRLWPLSRRSFPKQYLAINDESQDSFLQTTLNRIKNIINIDSPIVICNEEHRFVTAEQIREIGIKPKSILLEPCSRNTAPAIILATLKSITFGIDPILLILPADHQIKNNKEFINSINISREAALKGKIVTFGIEPTNPETGYGYIKSFKPFEEDNLKTYKIEQFIEKPNKLLAEEFCKDKRFSWNSGIFVAKASTILEEVEKYSPEILNLCRKSINNKNFDLDFERVEKKYFEKCPNISIDKAIMEKTNSGVVCPLKAEWSDIGGWKSYWENSPKDINGNILIGNSLEISSKNSLIAGYSRLTVALGVEDLVIVETNDALLVTKKDHSEKIKELVTRLKDEKRIESEENRKVYRPWGNYFSVEEDLNWKIKRIEVNPESSLSLQLHKKRAEHWIVVRGIANVEINEKKFLLKENQSCFIPEGYKHRLSNLNKEPLIIIEVQSGSYLGEDDIIRFEDNYGRKDL